VREIYQDFTGSILCKGRELKEQMKTSQKRKPYSSLAEAASLKKERKPRETIGKPLNENIQ